MRISDWSSDVCSSDLLPALAATVKAIGAEGTEGFYRGALAKKIAADLAVIGSPVAAEDLARRSEERRGGKECVRTCRSRWLAYHSKKKKSILNKNTSCAQEQDNQIQINVYDVI